MFGPVGGGGGVAGEERRGIAWPGSTPPMQERGRGHDPALRLLHMGQ